MKKSTYNVGLVSIGLIFSGAILRTFHLPGASILLVIGTFCFIAIFAVMFTLDKVSLERRTFSKISHIVLTIAIVLVLMSALFNLLHLPANRELGLLSIIVFTLYLVFFTRHTEGRKLRLQKDRQIACILFTDIVGFTDMMGRNEDKTLIALEDNKSVQNKFIRRYRGKWVKEIGDGTLTIFYTASEAVQCAVEIQKEIQSNHDFHVRMGLHIAEIYFTDNDIFGDGVNVAARICATAEADEICLSGVVHQNIKNRENFSIENLGFKTLKNVSYELELYKLKV